MVRRSTKVVSIKIKNFNVDVIRPLCIKRPQMIGYVTLW